MGYTAGRLLLIAVAAGALLELGRRGGRRSASTAGGLAAIGLAAILLHYASPRFDLDWRVPLPDGLWRDLVFAPGALLVGVALGRARETRRGRILTLLLALGYAVFLLHDPLFVAATASDNLGPATVRDDVVLQRNGRNCMPASAATILRRWGISEASDGELALRAQTSYYGTPEHRVVAAIEAVGAPRRLQALRVRTTWDELRAIDHPVILGVSLVGAVPHAIALLGLDADAVQVGEPLVGLQVFYGLKLFEGWKHWDGVAILIGQDFVHDLGPGDRSPVVARVRGTLGVPGGDVFEPALADAVRAFQTGAKLPVTGRLDAKTILALDARAQRGKIPSLRWRAPPRKTPARPTRRRG